MRNAAIQLLVIIGLLMVWTAIQRGLGRMMAAGLQMLFQAMRIYLGR